MDEGVRSYTWARSARVPLLTDVSGEPYWTIIAEASVEQIDDFFAMEETLTANDTIRKAMADYHDLVENGRREIYRVES